MKRLQNRLVILSSTVLVAVALMTSSVRSELPAGRTVDTEEVCLACHDLDGALEAKAPHAPVVGGDCTACHNPHASRFEHLLMERPASLCVACHDDLGEVLDRAVVHEPVADGRCGDCHEPHGADHAGLLAKPAKELCRDCHAEMTEWEGREVAHRPFKTGSCAVCHDPHASDHPALMSASGGGRCTSCHPVTAAFRQQHSGYPVENAPCRQCHDPHASARDGLFRARLHEPFEGGDCTTCHAAADAAEPFALVARQDELCGACHEEQVAESLSAAFPHVSAGGTACAKCHNPHAGDGAGLLNATLESVCLGCHDPGGASSGEPGRYTSHAGMECSTCHSPHGGDQPLLLTQDSVELCGTCHEHEHGIRHPLGDETRDPRSGNPMTCLSCHGIHDAPHEMYLFGSPERDLCAGCHQDIVGGA